MIAESFEEWKYCIEKDCNIQLTKEFAKKRLSVYLNKQATETQKFISLYGEEHLENIIKWFKLI